MKKRHELINPESCLNKAHDDEMIFVLRGKDDAAPTAIRAWVAERIRLGKNLYTDDKIFEAEHCARMMEQNHAKYIELSKAREQLAKDIGQKIEEIDNAGLCRFQTNPTFGVMFFELIGLCKCGVHITINQHRDYYQTVRQYMFDRVECFSDLAEEVKEAMAKADTIVEIQFYPRTPIGFYRVFHHHPVEALKLALELAKKEAAK